MAVPRLEPATRLLVRRNNERVKRVSVTILCVNLLSVIVIVSVCMFGIGVIITRHERQARQSIQ